MVRMEAVLLLLSGASGAGKTSVRESISGAVGDAIEAVELRHLGAVPANPDIAWRQRMADGRWLAPRNSPRSSGICCSPGDPIAPGEVLAAPSAPSADIAVCLLDVSAQVQRDRLRRRGDPESLLPHHVAFADWLRRHAADPRHMPHVLADGGWADMRWSRLNQMSTDNWQITVIDSSPLSPADTSRLVLQWIRDAV